VETYYFTFGCGSPLANCYVKVEAEQEEIARLQMYCWFTTHWASVYRSEEGFKQGVEKYGLTEIKVPKSASVRLMTNHEEIRPEIMDKVYGTVR
jgi:hypothetical protein